MTNGSKTDFDDDDASDEEYFAFVTQFCQDTARRFREAQGDHTAQKHVLTRYWKIGLRANLSSGTLIDFLAVSSPSILDMAGYSLEEGDLIMQLSDNLIQAEVNAADSE